MTNNIISMRIVSIFILFMFACTAQIKMKAGPSPVKEQVSATLKKFILDEAEWAMQQEPVTVTAQTSARSAGGKHDFFSEGDYWWPNPVSADSPYIQRDGMTNPDNFVAHRLAMIRFSKVVGALASAYKITGDEKYVQHALKHCRAWFTDEATLMNPNLLYAQAIKGRFTGRGIGIIDTIQLMEVVQGLLSMLEAKSMNQQDISGIRNWFDRYIEWLTTHKYGKDEMNAENNHGTCWVMQVASFAKFTGNRKVLDFAASGTNQYYFLTRWLLMEVSQERSVERSLMVILFSISMRWRQFARCFLPQKIIYGTTRLPMASPLKKELNFYILISPIKINGPTRKM